MCPHCGIRQYKNENADPLLAGMDNLCWRCVKPLDVLPVTDPDYVTEADMSDSDVAFLDAARDEDEQEDILLRAWRGCQA